MAMLPSYKDIVELLKKGSTLEAQEKIMELRSAVLELQEENSTLRDTVKALEAKLAVRGSVTWDRPYYWLFDGEKRDGPFCQLCYDQSPNSLGSKMETAVSGAVVAAARPSSTRRTVTESGQ